MELRSDHISAYLSVRHTHSTIETHMAVDILKSHSGIVGGSSDNRKNRDKVQLLFAKKKEKK